METTQEVSEERPSNDLIQLFQRYISPFDNDQLSTINNDEFTGNIGNINNEHENSDSVNFQDLINTVINVYHDQRKKEPEFIDLTVENDDVQILSSKLPRNRRRKDHRSRSPIRNLVDLSSSPSPPPPTSEPVNPNTSTRDQCWDWSLPPIVNQQQQTNFYNINEHTYMGSTPQISSNTNTYVTTNLNMSATSSSSYPDSINSSLNEMSHYSFVKKDQIPLRRSSASKEVYNVIGNETDDKLNSVQDKKSSNKQCTSLRSDSPVAAVKCLICLEDHLEIQLSGRRMVSTICGHIFCQLCLQTSMKTKKMCPQCRRKITKRSFHPIFI